MRKVGPWGAEGTRMQSDWQRASRVRRAPFVPPVRQWPIALRYAVLVSIRRELVVVAPSLKERRQEKKGSGGWKRN